MSADMTGVKVKMLHPVWTEKETNIQQPFKTASNLQISKRRFSECVKISHNNCNGNTATKKTRRKLTAPALCDVTKGAEESCSCPALV